MGLSMLLLQNLLEDLDGGDEDPDKKIQTYIQPPANTEMVYPCILIEIDDEKAKYADNLPWFIAVRYLVTIIDEDPLSLLPGLVAKLPTCAFARKFVSDNLNHTVYQLYF